MLYSDVKALFCCSRQLWAFWFKIKFGYHYCIWMNLRIAGLHACPSSWASPPPLKEVPACKLRQKSVGLSGIFQVNRALLAHNIHILYSAQLWKDLRFLQITIWLQLSRGNTVFSTSPFWHAAQHLSDVVLFVKNTAQPKMYHSHFTLR